MLVMWFSLSIVEDYYRSCLISVEMFLVLACLRDQRILWLWSVADRWFVASPICISGATSC